ncbi:MAG: hypothetical protein BWY63_01916 [Chloroflexi bacterium ADurb.Bin360]|nr:MAG: hypothetical protein BWY63_01916 [Chloroflexi bacterium ADurb.Bin360]
MQLIAEIGVCNADKPLRPLPDGFAVEVHRAIFSHDPVHMVAGGHDACARGEYGFDATKRPVFGSARQGNDGEPPPQNARRHR